MSLITKIVSNLVLLIIGITWSLLCLYEKELLSLPDSVLWASGILFAGDRGIDLVIQKLGLQKGV